MFLHPNETILFQEDRNTNFDEIITGYFFRKFITYNADSKNKEDVHINEILRALSRKFAVEDEFLNSGLGRQVEMPTFHQRHFRTCSLICTEKKLCLEMKRLTWLLWILLIKDINKYELWPSCTSYKALISVNVLEKSTFKSQTILEDCNSNVLWFSCAFTQGIIYYIWYLAFTI